MMYFTLYRTIRYTYIWMDGWDIDVDEARHI